MPDLVVPSRVHWRRNDHGGWTVEVSVCERVLTGVITPVYPTQQTGTAEPWSLVCLETTGAGGGFRRGYMTPAGAKAAFRRWLVDQLAK